MNGGDGDGGAGGGRCGKGYEIHLHELSGKCGRATNVLYVIKQSN